jgi:hypothetical protein
MRSGTQARLPELFCDESWYFFAPTWIPLDERRSECGGLFGIHLDKTSATISVLGSQHNGIQFYSPRVSEK